MVRRVQVATVAAALALWACDAREKPAVPTIPAAPATATPSAAPAPSAAPSAAPSDALPLGAMQSVVTLDPGTPTQQAALNAAKEELASGHEKPALEHFRKAMQGPLTGTSVSAALATADLLVARHHTDEAAALYKEMLHTASLVPEVQFAAGRFFWERGDDASAIGALQATLALQPDFLPAWQLLGIVQSRAGRNGDAGRTLTEYELRMNKFVRRANDQARPPGDRLAAVQLLSTVADDRAVEATVQALHDPVAGIRLAAAQILAEDEAPEALQGLSEAALAEKDPDLRVVLAGLLDTARHRAHREAAGPLPALPAPPSAAVHGPTSGVAPSRGAP